jgi:two-component system response regulator AtoC
MLTMGDDLPPTEVIFGRSTIMRAVWKKVGQVALVNVPVLISGESGTGKEIIAKLIHRLSPWSQGPFVKVTCPAIPGTLMESELFGYEKGAFTGAYRLKRGQVEAAHQGTLFLDEIGELDFGLQAKLLQLLQDGTYSRIGGQTERLVEMRVVSATNRHLGTEIENARFRQDLFHRINGVGIRMPALRERLEDIPEIADYLLTVYNRKFKTSAPRFSSSFLSCLQQRQWPGNIRELENVVRRYAILGWDNRDILSSRS